MLRLRPYISEDAKTIAAWFDSEESFRKWSADQYKDFPVLPQQISDKYAEAGREGTFLAFTAFDEEGIAGHFTIRYVDEARETARLGFVVVDSKRRGCGYGREMLGLGLKYAFEFLGVWSVTIGVFENNLPARKCYEALGFHNNRNERPSVYQLCGEKWLCLELIILRNEWEEKERLEE